MRKAINGFEFAAKQIAESYSEVDDPLIFEGIEINEDGKKEAFFHDKKCVYYVDEDFAFNYACAR